MYGHGQSNNNTMSAQDQQQWQTEIANGIPIIDDRLYFTVSVKAAHTPNIHMFSIDHVLRYEPFFVDFGPLNLGCLYKFCKLLDHKLNDDKLKKMKIYYFCDRSPQKVSNAAYLIGAYQVISLNRSPEEAYSRVKTLGNYSMKMTIFHIHTMHSMHCPLHFTETTW